MGLFVTIKCDNSLKAALWQLSKALSQLKICSLCGEQKVGGQFLNAKVLNGTAWPNTQPPAGLDVGTDVPCRAHNGKWGRVTLGSDCKRAGSDHRPLLLLQPIVTLSPL